MTFNLARPAALGLAAALLLIAPAADAGKHHRQRPAAMQSAELLPAYAQECAGGCHVAYPPGMLPGASWRRIMAGLEQHYGSDASLDAATTRQIDAWLQSQTCDADNPAPACWRKGRRAMLEAPPEDRITLSAWFERKHRRIAPADWQRPDIQSAANCAACHSLAEQGDYRKRSLRMPAGMPQHQRRWRD